MTNLEHLIENTLFSIENGEYRNKKYSEIIQTIQSDINYDESTITAEQCWEICQYVYYTYNHKSSESTPNYEDCYTSEWEVLKTPSGNEYTVCKNCKIDFSIRTGKGTIAKLDMRGVNYCPHCGVQMK